MMVNEKLFLSFAHFPGDPDRIHHFFYVLLRMYPLFITPGNRYTANEYVTGNPGSDTRCDVASDPNSITVLN